MQDIKSLIIGEFDEKFENFYDLGTPNEEDMNAGSEIEHYEHLKAFLTQLITALTEKPEQKSFGKLKPKGIGSMGRGYFIII